MGKRGYGEGPREQSVSVRKIGNGYIRTEHQMGPGGFSHKETYHPTDPGLSQRESGQGQQAQSKSLREAIDHVKGKKP